MYMYNREKNAQRSLFTVNSLLVFLLEYISFTEVRLIAFFMRWFRLFTSSKRKQIKYRNNQIND